MARFQTQRYELEGQQIDSPVDWRGAKVVLAFNDNVQPKLSVETLTFVNKSLDPICKHINEGRIFEGMDLNITLSDEETTLTTFEGMLDPSSFEQITPNKAELRLIAKNGLDTVNERLEALTALFLYSKGYLRNQVDVNFAVEPKVDEVYYVSTSITILLLVNALEQQIAQLGRDIADVAAIAAGGSPGTGQLASLAQSIALAAITLIYTGVLVVAIIKLVKDLIASFIQPIRQHKAISWDTVLKDTSNYLGYGFNTSIPDLDKFVQLPSNQSVLKTVNNGIPNAQDYGYNLADFFNQVSTTFNARYAVIDGNIEMHPVWSSFWIKNATAKIPSNIQEKESFRYNTDELVRSRELVFAFDLSEEYSANENYRVQGGGVIEQGIDGVKDLLKGYESYRVNHSFGNRKESLSRLEKLIRDLAKIADTVVDTFGGSSNLANKVKNRVGTLRVSTPNHAISKMLYLSGGNLPSNHAQYLNADYLYQEYYLPSSFANGGQKKVYDGVTVPFNLSILNDFIKNSYFIGNTGAVSRMISIEWEIDSDTAVVSYDEDFTYTNKLTERLI